MDDCVFCKILNSHVEASRIYENDATLAFMDLRQPNPGHVLVIPQRHVATIDELDAELAAQVFQTVIMVAKAIKSVFAPPGLHIWQSNGEAAGQEVFHFHMHLLPRYNGDGLMQIYPALPAPIERQQLDQWARKLTAVLPLAS